MSDDFEIDDDIEVGSEADQDVVPSDGSGAFGLFSPGPQFISVDEILRISQARTGTSLTIDDPIVLEMVALDVAFRWYTREMAKLVTRHGEIYDRQTEKIEEAVGKRIDDLAAAAVQAIKSNSNTMKESMDKNAAVVSKAEHSMIHVVTTAKVLLGVTAGLAAVMLTAMIATAVIVLTGSS